jgi:putative endonuclease
MCFVYILKSEKNNGYYIGCTAKSVEERLKEHNEGKFENSYTKRDRPWVIYHSIQCDNIELARKIEKHIKLEY